MSRLMICASRACRLALGALLFTSSVAAQKTPGPPWDVVRIHSRILGGERTIQVALPDGYERGNRRYPVLVLLDADAGPMFRLGVAQAAYLADNTDAVPLMIVVGVVNGPDRIHDMTPPAQGSSIAEFPTAGGASAFGDFIEREVLPVVRQKYRALPTTVLAGFSAGGLFALYSAATRPERFQGVIAMDPAIWYNDAAPAREFADGIARSAVRPRLFVSHGGGDARDRQIDTTTRNFALRLDSLRPGDSGFAHRRYPDDTHSLAPLSGLPDGLRFVFAPLSTTHVLIPPRNADSAQVMQALAAAESVYASGARPMLLPPQLPEASAYRLARFAINTLRRVDLAMLVLQRNAVLHPESARALATLADGYLIQGDTAAAIVQLARAIEKSRSSGAELPPNAEARLARLRASRGGR